MSEYCAWVYQARYIGGEGDCGIIISSGLVAEITDTVKARFDHCPVCGKKINMYRPSKDEDQEEKINNLQNIIKALVTTHSANHQSNNLIERRIVAIRLSGRHQEDVNAGIANLDALLAGRNALI